MLKNAFVLILGLFAFQSVKAQKTQNSSPQDTLVYYMTNSGRVTDDRDSANYFISVMPPDRNVNKKLFLVKEFYLTGVTKLTGASRVKSYDLKLEGGCIDFYPNGRKKDVMNYNDGSPVGNITEYYDNGQVYIIGNYDRDKKLHTIQCMDLTGKSLAENGNGTIIKLDENRKKIIAEGPVSNGLEEGDWKGSINDTGKYVCSYNKGVIISGTGHDRFGRTYPFKKIEVAPVYNGGLGAFHRFIVSKVVYPAEIKNHTPGSRYEYDIVFSFDVEKDGSLTNIKLIKPPIYLLVDTVMNAISLSPRWTPAYLYGMPVKKEVIISMTLVDSYQSTQ
jgi:antitoxin component YwqK of YwqJK toxin-antitoxin module